MEINIRQMKIKNHPDYIFNDNMIVNIKDFDSSLLEIYKFSFKGVFSLNIYYKKSLQKVFIILMMIKIIFICFLMM